MDEIEKIKRLIKIIFWIGIGLVFVILLQSLSLILCQLEVNSCGM